MTVEQTDADLRHRLGAAGLGSFVPSLLALRRPGIRLTSHPADETELAVGSSRLGGRADLPPAVEWPVFRDMPLAFVAQIDLAQVHPYDRDEVLPPSGLLSFFYDADEQGVWGFDPADRGGWSVLFTPAQAALTRRDHPAGLGEYARFAAASLSADPELNWAPAESFDIEQLLSTREQLHAYAVVTGQDNDEDDGEQPDETVHRLLGHPDLIQGDMQTECQLVTRGVYCGDPAEYTSADATAMIPGSGDWRLLLQVDSDDSVGMMWGDVGRLYYWIRRDQLAERAWDCAWLILQCS